MVDLKYGVDVIEGLKSIPDESVQCVVTSPPYWALRDYGVDGQIGLEKTPEEFIEKLMGVFREVRRVLRKDGTIWVNMGDGYASNGSGGHGKTGGRDKSTLAGPLPPIDANPITKKTPFGMKQKDLIGQPWMLAFALRADGWYLRSDIIWSKPNPMPESVIDRPTKAHEYIFLLSKSSNYFYDAEAIREPLASDPQSWGRHGKKDSGLAAPKQRAMFGANRNGRDGTDWGNGSTRNKRSVWEIASEPYPEAHFATFPMELVKPCILAGTSAKGACTVCGSPWIRIIEASGGTIGKSWHNHEDDAGRGHRGGDDGNMAAKKYGTYKREEKGWKPSCECAGGGITPCTVLDPFSGSATTGEVATGLGRQYIGIELNKKYLELAKKRLGLFALNA